MKKSEYVLFDDSTKAIIYGNQQKAVQRMMDFDFLSGRKTPSVACVVNPTALPKDTMSVFFGRQQMLIPVYSNLKDASDNHRDADVLINFASFRSSHSVSMHALSIETIRTIVVIAEGIPERKSRELIAEARKYNDKWIIGPATVGGLKGGAFKIGNAGGALSNIRMSKLYRQGSVGFVSKSGGMMNEMINVISLNTDGINEAIAIGGDRFPYSTLPDHIKRFERNESIRLIVMLGEVGGSDEYSIAEAVSSGIIKKPVVGLVTGSCAGIFPAEMQFGHAGAMASGEKETANAKNRALKEAGVYVPDSFDDMDKLIKDVYENIGPMKPEIDKEADPPQIPVDYNPSTMRKTANIVTTISDDSKEELLYSGIPISRIIEDSYSIGDVISLLWFKKKFPSYVPEFIELALTLTADHGPCVSGAHNAIVTARAGKDLTAAIASGILTIGERFGGALDDSAKYFKAAYDRRITPEQFIDEMKNKGINIPGIGHRVKSVSNPDMRVELLRKWANGTLRKHPLMDYAFRVEQITTMKKDNLILNVDGCIGVLFVDILVHTGIYSGTQIDEIISNGTLNGIFVLGRTIGMIGHYLDQKRMGAKLYRHPWEDVLYMLPEEEDVIMMNKEDE